MLLKAVCQCSFRFVSDGIVRVLGCDRALLRQNHCSDDSFLAQIVTMFSSFLARRFSAHLNETHVFAARTHTSFLRAHVADHRSTVCFSTNVMCSSPHLLCLFFVCCSVRSQPCVNCGLCGSRCVTAKKCTSQHVQRTGEEPADKNAVGSRRAAWRIIARAEQTEKTWEDKQQATREEADLQEVCDDIQAPMKEKLAWDENVVRKKCSHSRDRKRQCGWRCHAASAAAH